MSSPDRRTDLHHAALDGDVGTVERLLAGGADPEAADVNGFTALHFAAQEQHPQVVAMLIDGGAFVDSRDRYGNTPLGRAVFNSRGRGDTIKALLQGGADPDIVNAAGQTPRGLANLIANYNVAQFLPDQS